MLKIIFNENFAMRKLMPRFILITCFILTGCGQSGALYLPRPILPAEANLQTPVPTATGSKL